jgi:PAS domain S-box-containing protein
MPAEPDSASISAPTDTTSSDELRKEVETLRGRLVEMNRLADAIPHIVWTMTPEGTPTYLNAKWTELTGLDLDATLRVQARSFVHPDDLPAFDAERKKASVTGTPFEVGYRLRRAADGVYIWHVARVVPLRTDQGQVAAWIATATNVDEQRTRENEQHYLVEASRVLGTSLDLRQTLSDVAKLLVPQMADWCAIDIVKEDVGIDRQAVAHVDPSKVALAWDLWKRAPPKPEDPHGVYAVLRSGQAEVLSEVTDELLVASIPEPEMLALVRSLGLRSSMCVPLLVRGRTIGALTLVTSESNKLYTPRDLAFATELARRVAVAVDNARLYGVAEAARTAAEAMAADVIEQSRTVEQALIAMRAERDAALAGAAGAVGKNPSVAPKA